MSESGKRISAEPTAGLSYDPSQPVYWDPAALHGEVLRAFDICNGCRMCFKFCDSFPRLFTLLDARDHDAHRLSAPEIEGVMDDCFQCKLCEVQCPYTPRDGHPFQLDFPALVHRYDAQKFKARGGKPNLRERFLGDPDRSGKLARMSLGLANAMNKVAPARWAMEKVLGVDRHAALPDFATTAFDTWAEGAGWVNPEPGGDAVLFQTCFVQNNDTRLGADTLEVLKKNGVDVRVVKGLRCCGMPVWEHGDIDQLRLQAHDDLDLLLPYVEKGAKVLVVNPTCSMMMRREWPHLLEGVDRERAAKLAPAVMDVSEYLWSIRNEPRFSKDFRSVPPGGKVAYHAPCHLRAQAVGFKGRDLIRRIPGVEIAASVLECCGHDGTYAMTVEGHDASGRIGKAAFDGMKGAEAQVWCTDCPLAAVQFEQFAGNKPLHPMTVLARAYRENGFGEGGKGTPS